MKIINLDQTDYKKLDAKSYELEKRRLRIEFLKLQEDVIKNNRRICIVFAVSYTHLTLPTIYSV